MQRTLATLSILLILVLALAGFLSSIYYWFTAFQLIQHFTLYKYLYSIYSIGTLFLLATTVVGLVAVRRSLKGCMFAYWISLSVWMVVFVAIGIVAGYAEEKLTNHDCKTFMPKLTTLYSEAASTLCHEKCPCFYLSYLQSQTEELTINPLTANLTYSSSNQSMPVRIQQCPNFQTKADPSHIQLMAVLETKFTCSNWCTTSNYFLFTSINRGLPESSCFAALSEYLTHYGRIIMVVCLTIAAALTLSIIISIFYLICSRQSTSQEPQWPAKKEGAINEAVNQGQDFLDEHNPDEVVKSIPEADRVQSIENIKSMERHRRVASDLSNPHSQRKSRPKPTRANNKNSSDQDQGFH